MKNKSRGSIGTFEVTGKAYLLNEFVDSGIGSPTGSGFGMVEKSVGGDEDD